MGAKYTLYETLMPIKEWEYSIIYTRNRKEEI